MGAFKVYNTTTSQWEYAKTRPANSTLVNGADVTGLVNGTNKEFTTPTPFAFINVYKNGVRMRFGADNDYTIVGNNKIVFNTAPATGAVITVDYGTIQEQMIQGSNSIVTGEWPSHSGDIKTFTTDRPYIPGTLEVFLNGLRLGSAFHFFETNPATGVFTLDEAALSTDNLCVNYQTVVSTSANADTVDGYHASATPLAGQIPVLDSNAQLPNSALGGAWTAWTPTLSSSSGSFGNANASGRYKVIGKTVHYYVTINIVTNGTAAGPRFSLPVTARFASEFVGSGREDAVNGKMLQVKSISATTGHIWYYDNTDPNANGLTLRIAGTYEAA